MACMCTISDGIELPVCNDLYIIITLLNCPILLESKTYGGGSTCRITPKHFNLAHACTGKVIRSSHHVCLSVCYHSSGHYWYSTEGKGGVRYLQIVLDVVI